uniref:Uncharacterized protein n=1 Tax=Rhizophora mucronata TaxID=61149 RepID=A0A2P2NC91_RHIMU
MSQPVAALLELQQQQL